MTDVLPLQSTNLDTYKKASGLQLQQLGNYAIFVIGKVFKTRIVYNTVWSFDLEIEWNTISSCLYVPTSFTGFDEAGECNLTSATFTVDNSLPITGKIRTGPFYDMVNFKFTYFI